MVGGRRVGSRTNAPRNIENFVKQNKTDSLLFRQTRSWNEVIYADSIDLERID